MAMVLLFETASTVMSVNYDALFPELFQGFRERTRASAIYQGFSMSGELVGFALTPIVYAQFGFVGMAVLFAAVTGVTLLIGIRGQFRRPTRPGGATLGPARCFRRRAPRPPLLALRHRPDLSHLHHRRLYPGDPLLGQIHAGGRPPGALSRLCDGLYRGHRFGLAVEPVAPRHWGVKRTWLWAVAVMLSSAIALGLATNLVVGLIGAALAGVGLGGIKVCREMIVANLVDRSLARTGHRQEGAYYSLLRVFGKLSKVLEAGALVCWVCSLATSAARTRGRSPAVPSGF